MELETKTETIRLTEYTKTYLWLVSLGVHLLSLTVKEFLKF